MRTLTLAFFIVFSCGLRAQSQDSVQVLKFNQFYDYVISNHPIVKQARLLTEEAAQQLRLARGSFDPKLEGTWDFKDFKGTEYHNVTDVALKIPTWFPVDPKVGVLQKRGEFLNREDFISEDTDNRQVYLGVSVPIGQGLFIDQRRATMKKAKLLQNMAEAEQVKEINKVLLTAAKDYWQWYFAYMNYQLIQQSITIAQDIFDRTKIAYNYGETAAIDTIQAKIVLQSRQVDFQQANIERIKAALNLSNHLWNANDVPLEIVDNVKPEESGSNIFDQGVLEQLVTMARQNHPELVKLNLKNKSLVIDKQLAKENMKPRLDLDYTLLDQPIAPNGDNNGLNFSDNYKLGVSFAFPIFLRKERGKLGQIDIKMKQNDFERNFKEREIVNDIGARYNAVLVTGNILQQQEAMVNNYQLIMAAERLNLQNGESDLFKINVQFEKLIKSQTKLFKLRSEYQKNIASLYWAAGVSNLGYQ